MPHYRKKLWDGKIRLFSPHNGRIYVGLLPYIKEFCSRNSIEYIIEKGVEDERNVIRESAEILPPHYDPKVGENLYNFVIIKLMQSGMLYKEIVCLFVMSYCFGQVINNLHTCSILSFDES